MPRAALLSPHSRALCSGAVSLEVVFLLLKPSPGTGVGFPEQCTEEVLQQTSFALKAVVTACFDASFKQPLGKF